MSAVITKYYETNLNCTHTFKSNSTFYVHNAKLCFPYRIKLITLSDEDSYVSTMYFCFSMPRYIQWRTPKA